MFDWISGVAAGGTLLVVCVVAMNAHFEWARAAFCARKGGLEVEAVLRAADAELAYKARLIKHNWPVAICLYGVEAVRGPLCDARR